MEKNQVVKTDKKEEIYIEPKIEEVWNKESEILFIGTITVNEGLDNGFYYTSDKNQFWTLIDSIFIDSKSKSFVELKEKLSKNKMDKNIIQEFREELLNRKIAICDVYKSCYFRNNSSSDSDILTPLSRNLVKVTKADIKEKTKFNEEKIMEIIENSQVDKVFLNGSKAYNFFISWKEKYPKIFEKISIFKLISSSPAARVSVNLKKHCWEEIIKNNVYIY